VNQTESPHSHAIQGMLIALAAFSCLSLGDGLVKSMAGQIPGTEVALLRYLFGVFGLGLALAITKGRAGFICPRPVLQWARGAAIAAATFGFFMGVQYMPLANATSVQFTSPMLTAVLSALFLGERASRAVWISIAMAFVGVLIVLRPQVLMLGSAAFYPLLSALSMAFLMIFNRKASGTAPLLELQFLAGVFAMLIIAGGTVALHLTGMPQFALHMPNESVIAKCVMVAVTGTISHSLLFVATQRASAAVISPMMYVQLLVAVLIGYVVFHNVPTVMTLLGALCIVAGGLYLAHDTRRSTSK